MFLDYEGLKRYTKLVKERIESSVSKLADEVSAAINALIADVDAMDDELAARIDTKQDVLSAGDGIDIGDNTVSVETPVRRVITQAEFDALPENEKTRGVYFIPDSGYETGYETNIYSIEELIVGRWIDGKPIYRKVVITTSPSSDGVVVYKFDGFSPEYLDVRIMITDSRGYIFPGSYAGSSNYYTNYNYKLDDNGIKIGIGSSAPLFNRPMTMVLEYTKSTDKVVNG